MRLAAGETTIIVSYAGHQFVARGEKENNLLGHMEVERDQTFYLKEIALESGNLQCSSADGEEMKGFPEDEQERIRIQQARDGVTQFRLTNNVNQPKTVPHFTELG